MNNLQNKGILIDANVEGLKINNNKIYGSDAGITMLGKHKNVEMRRNKIFRNTDGSISPLKLILIGAAGTILATVVVSILDKLF